MSFNQINIVACFDQNQSVHAALCMCCLCMPKGKFSTDTAHIHQVLDQIEPATDIHMCVQF